VLVRREEGFTLVELLVAISLAMLVLVGTFTLVRTTMDLSGGVVRRTDALQRGRLAMDRVTRELRSQVCLDASTPAMISGTDTAVSFYADLGAPGGLPARYALTLDPVARALVETRTDGTQLTAGGAITLPAQPTRTINLLEDAAAPAAGPVFSYFAYASTGTPRRTTVALPVPLSVADRRRVARIAIAFTARPQSTADASKAFEVRDQITVRHADPNAVSPTPTCA
jgi:Tfp pilus assembly protein PilW